MIAFVSIGEVDVIGKTGSDLRRIARCACETQSDAAAWSPDGKELTFSGAHGVYVVRATGTDLRRVVGY